VAIVVYAGNAGLVLGSTPGSDKQRILEAIDRLQAGGSTAGGAGIQLAYKIARENFIKGGNNRVVLATDGDFNVGVSSDGELTRIVEEKRKDGIFLTVLGFGTGNYKDSKMEQVADKGNGNYYYIDTLKEGKKVLVSELGSTLFTIAKDVKIQIEFNPAQVKAYRLVGYENRILAKEDFNDDTKDAGELGAGHTVTAMYEIVPVDSAETFSSVDKLAYQKTEVVPSSDLMTVKLRYKDPDGDTSKLIQQTVQAEDVSAEPAGDFQFASVVAEFGLILRDSKFKGNASYEHVLKGASVSKGKDSYGYREEFIGLVGKAQSLDTRTGGETEGINFKGE
jgi:Ca-activated chloride channel family protein